jgi:hypothetical protein
MTKQVRQSITPTHVLGSTGTAEGDTLGHRALADLKADLALNNVDNTSDATKNSATATLTNKTINLANNTLQATSAQLAAAVADETGTGALVFASSPALAGTPTAPTAAAGTNTTQVATTAFVQSAVSTLAEAILIGQVAQFTYDITTTSPAASIARTVPQYVIDNLYDKMRGCVLNADGSVNYYLKADDWTLQEDGTTPSVLTGADGNVMIEVPRFYFRVVRIGTEVTWQISPVPIPGFAVHPGFIKDGTERATRYYSAYDACVQLASDGSYISGENLDNATALVNTSTDKLASVKGIYPMVGLTRAEFRALAANNGTGWRQLDFPLWNAVAMLYLVEAQTFFSQDVLGNGNTNNTYATTATDPTQAGSPHTIAGFRDDVANGSTTPANGQGTATRPGTVAMKYRGIENIFGNCFNFADAINVSVSTTGNVYLANGNDRTNYADNTVTNHTLITSSLPTASGDIQTLLPIDPYFLAESFGGTSSQYITDRHFGNTSTGRTFAVGGSASDGGSAGVFRAAAGDSSSTRIRTVGARLAF